MTKIDINDKIGIMENLKNILPVRIICFVLIGLNNILCSGTVFIDISCCSPQKPGHFSRCCMGRDELAG